MMTNITLSIEQEDLKQARILALQQGSSLNVVIREFIQNYISKNHCYQQVTKRILEKANSSQ